MEGKSLVIEKEEHKNIEPTVEWKGEDKATVIDNPDAIE